LTLQAGRHRLVPHVVELVAPEGTNREISGGYLLALSHHRPRSDACCCRLDCCRHRGKNQRRQRKDSGGIPRHRCMTGWGDSSARVAPHTCGLCRSCHCCYRGKNPRHRCTTGWRDSSPLVATHTCGFRRSCHRRCTTSWDDSSARGVIHTCGFCRNYCRRLTGWVDS
jgi:hypothetical protein